MVDKQNILLNRTKNHLIIVNNVNRVDLNKHLIFIWLRKHRINAILRAGDKIELPGGGSVIFRAAGEKLHGIRADYTYEAH